MEARVAINNLNAYAKEFSFFVENEFEGSDEEELKSRVHTLAQEVILCATGDSTASCSQLLYKATQLNELSSLRMKPDSQVKLQDRFYKLTSSALSIIEDKLLEAPANSSWLDSFFSVEQKIRNKLIRDPRFEKKMSTAIAYAGPNFLINPQAGITLFMQLCNDENSIISKFSLDFLEKNNIDVNQTTKQGNTALHAAAMRNDINLVNSLLSKGADPCLSNLPGKIPFDMTSNTECQNALINGISLKKVIGEEQLANQILILAKNLNDFSSWEVIDYNNIPVFKEIADYFKSHYIDVETLKKLTNNDSHILLGLLEQGYMMYNLPDKDFFHLFFRNTLSLNQIKTILDSGRLIFDGFNGKDMFTVIESNPISFLIQNELREAKEVFDSEALLAFKSLARNMATEGMNKSQRAIKMEFIDHDFQVLIDKNIPGANKAKINFDTDPINIIQRENLPKAKELFERPIAAAMKAREAVGMGLEITSILKYLARKTKDHELLSEIERFLDPYLGFFSPVSGKFMADVEMTAMNKIIVNVALDKMYFSERESYKGGAHHWIASYFAHALEITESNLKVQDCFNKLELTKKILKKCCADLQEMSRLSDSGIDSFKENEHLNELVTKISSLSKGESCLIPTLSTGHATLMRIENTGKEKVRILFYNTGGGVEVYHAKGKNDDTYQTFIEYTDVPIGNLQNSENFKGLIQKRSMSRMDDLTQKQMSMSQIYEMVQKLAEGGIKQPPSVHREYYEAIQKNGSCSYQCFLAMIRERLVTSVPDPAEGLALYKIVKGRMLNAFEEQTRNFRNDKVNALFQSKIKLIGVELRIVNELADQTKRDNLAETLVAELKAQNLDSLAEEVEESSLVSSLKLFTIIRRAISALESLENPLTQTGLVTDAVMFKREKEALSKQEYRKILNEFLLKTSPKDIEDWLQCYAAEFFGGAYKKIAEEWAVSQLNRVPKGLDDIDHRAKLLNTLLTVINLNVENEEQKVRVLTPLLTVFKQAGNPAMVDYIERVCLTSEKKSGE